MKIKDRYYLSHEKFKELFTNLEALGFEEKSSAATLREIREIGSVPFLKKKFEGREKLYTYRYKNKEITACTTFVPSINDINKQDYFWIIQKHDGNPVRFFWFPILRTTNFYKTALAHVKMFVEIIHVWAKCPECGEELLLIHTPGIMHLMEFFCKNEKFKHQKQNIKPYFIFDIPISDQNSELLFNGFKRNFEYEHTQVVKEKPHDNARIKRAERKKQAYAVQQQKTNFYGDIKNYGNSDELYNDGGHLD